MKIHVSRNASAKGCAFIFVSFCALMFAQSAHAFTFEPTELQYYLMPDYCKAKMSDFHRNREGSWSVRFPIDEKRIAYWKNAIGNDFKHMHHYCAGLVALSRAQTNPSSGAWRGAVSEISYTLSRSQPGSPLWKQMTIDYARALEGMGDGDKAMELLTQLVQRYPNNGDAYIALARTLERNGDLPGGIAVLEKGMRHVAKKGPLLFYLARYVYDLGEVERATELTLEAEKAGMKMDSLRKHLGSQLSGNSGAKPGVLDHAAVPGGAGE